MPVSDQSNSHNQHMFAVLPFVTPMHGNSDGVTWHNALWKAERVGERKVNVGTVVLHVLVGSGQVGQFSSFFLCRTVLGSFTLINLL